MAKTLLVSRLRPWLTVAALIVVVLFASAVGAWAQGVHAWHLLLWAGLAGAVVFAGGLLASEAKSRQNHRAEMVRRQQEALESSKPPTPQGRWEGEE